MRFIFKLASGPALALLLTIALTGYGVRPVTAKDRGCKPAATVVTQPCPAPTCQKVVTHPCPAPVPTCQVVDTKKIEHDAHEAAEECARAQYRAAKEQAKQLKEQAKAEYEAAKEQAKAIKHQAHEQKEATMHQLHEKVETAQCCPAEVPKEEVVAITPAPVYTPEPEIVAVLPEPTPAPAPEVTPAPEPTPVAAAELPKRLPKTAGSMDLIGLMGLLSMAAGLGTRFRR